jgi:hypothetical protein
MATYVNDLRLKEISTGDESGTWGTSTNTNLELIGEALGYATQQVFGSDADATTTIADGASDPARAMYFKITSAGSLTATRTCTIAPNTVSRVMFIENATSGSQSIAISQGSGASVTILTGKTAVVYLDGAGATAAVVDAMAGVDPGVTDTLTEVLVAGNTSGGTNIELSTTDKVQFRDAAIYLNSSVDGQLDIVADTEIQIAATTVDLNGNLDVSGTTVSAGKITADAGIDIDNINIDGTTIALSSGDLTLDVAGDIVLDAGGSEIRLSKAGTEFGKFATDIGTPLQFAISSSVLDGDIKLQGNDGGITITALTLDMSEAGAATFNAGATFGSGIDVTGTVTADGLTVDTDTLVVDATNNRVGIGTSSPDYTLDLGGATPVIRIGDAGSIQPTLTRNNSTGGLTYNTTGQSITSLIEFKDNGAERMRIDASGLVGIGTDSPASYYAAPLVVATSGVQGGITIANTTANKQGMLAFADGTAGSDRYSGYIDYNHSSNAMSFGTNGGSEKMRIDASGNVGIGTTSPSTFNQYLGNKKLVIGDGTTRSGVTIYSSNGASDFGALTFADGVTGTEQYRGAVHYQHDNDSMKFLTAATERLRIDSGGDVKLITADDTAGTYKFLTFGTNSYNRAGIKCTNAATYDGSLEFYTGNAIDFAERMRITSGGALEIGPAANKVIIKSQASFQNTTLESHIINADGTGAFGSGDLLIQPRCSSASSNKIVFGTSGGTNTTTERMRLDASGNLLVGDSAANGAGRIEAKAADATKPAIVARSGTASDESNRVLLCSKFSTTNTTSQVFVQFAVNNNGTASGQINANGASQVAFGSWSDSRLKENIIDLPSQLANITALRPVEFDYIESEGGGHQLGFIAQEVEEIYPDLVGERQDGMKTLSGMGKMEARLIKAIQEQQAIIEALTARIAALES